VNAHWRWVHTLGVALAIAALGAVGYWVSPPQVAWLFTMALMLLLLVIIGLGISGRPAGAWIDERNKMTLSRLQLIGWTIVVLSGFLVIALHNLQAKEANPLDVAIPQVLWLAMGISTASLVGSPLILASKEQQPANPSETERTINMLDRRPAAMPAGNRTTGRFQDDSGVLVDTTNGNVRAIGRVEVRGSPADASWADLFRGDETGNAAYVDMGKVQMLLLTAVVLLAYGLALYTTLVADGGIHEVPHLDEGMIALLFVSHAGYLSAKAVNHSTPPAPSTG
jgi:hypothetical protein